MQKKNNAANNNGRHVNPLPQEISTQEKAIVEKAHEEADKDMAEDADLSIHSPNDDLDEGETARLGEDGNPIQ